MNNKLINCLMAAAMLFVAIGVNAAEPTGYYHSAEGKTGKALLQALEKIVGPHTQISYNGLLDLYKYSDTGEDGYLMDMYSTAKFRPTEKQCGNYKVVGDCWNREHSFPKSWFGGKTHPMYSDAFHLYPTDGKVNGQRSNNPFGECANGTRLPASANGEALGKLGASTFPGYSGTVFEPDDQYKGDFARTYFYMAAAYNGKISGWSSPMLAGNDYPAYTSWAVDLLLKWSRLDPVSEKEKKRNEVIYDGGGTGNTLVQGNRNPFIDYPELAEYIWGDKVGQPWTATATAEPQIISPLSNATINFGVVAAGSTTSQSVTVQGTNLTQSLNVWIDGEGFTTSASTISASDAMAGKQVTIYYVAPATAGNYTASLVVESNEAGTHRFPITANVVTGIPANAANVQANSFVARWSNQKDTTTYRLYVYEGDTTHLMSSYPRNVQATAEQYVVSNLNPLTTYYFRVVGKELKSDFIEVHTIDVEHIVDIIGNSFDLSANRNQSALPVVEAQVYTENIDTDVTLTVEGDKFDISLDRTNWSRELTIDSDGETFYIRLNDVSVAGAFEGTLVATTPAGHHIEQDLTATVSVPTSGIKGDVNADGIVDVEDVNATVNGILNGELEWNGNEDVNGDGIVDVEDVNMIVNIILGSYEEPIETTTFTEGFEVTGFSYSTRTFDGDTFTWDFVDTGLFGDANRHGKFSARLGKTSSSSLTMAQDVETGATQVSFYAALWSGDNDLVLNLDYSTDGGETWTNAKTYNITDSQLQQYTCDVNIAGNVRFRLVQTEGRRANIDDFTIVDNPNAKAARAIEFTPEFDWDAVATTGAVTLNTARKTKLTVYNMDAQEVARFNFKGERTISLPAGTYVVAAGNHSKKVIVK